MDLGGVDDEQGSTDNDEQEICDLSKVHQP